MGNSGKVTKLTGENRKQTPLLSPQPTPQQTPLMTPFSASLDPNDTVLSLTGPYWTLQDPTGPRNYRENTEITGKTPKLPENTEIQRKHGKTVK